jgi:DNA/RNA endonuclease YhcR with UshA esterase domain
MELKFKTIEIIIIIFTSLSLAQTKTIAPQEAKDYIGKKVIVSGIVDQVTHSRSDTWFINMGGKYPDNAFTAVIFKADADKFKNLKDLEGKTIEVKGEIKDYRGTPEIILSDSDQLKIVTEK